MMYKLECLHC